MCNSRSEAPNLTNVARSGPPYSSFTTFPPRSRKVELELGALHLTSGAHSKENQPSWTCAASCLAASA